MYIIIIIQKSAAKRTCKQKINEKKEIDEKIIKLKKTVYYLIFQCDDEEEKLKRAQELYDKEINMNTSSSERAKGLMSVINKTSAIIDKIKDDIYILEGEQAIATLEIGKQQKILNQIPKTLKIEAQKLLESLELVKEVYY